MKKLIFLTAAILFAGCASVRQVEPKQKPMKTDSERLEKLRQAGKEASDKTWENIKTNYPKKQNK